MAVTTETMTLAEGHVRGFELVQRHTERFCDFVSALGEDQLALPVPGVDWTVGQTVTHVHSVYERYTSNLRRATSPAEVAVQNDEDIERLGVDVPASVAAMREHVAFLALIVPGVQPEQLFPFHAGMQTTLAGGWGNLIGELLAHGDDISRAVGRPFPIPSADTEVLWRFSAPLLEGWLRDQKAHDRWLLRFPFGPIGVVFDGSTLRWGSAPVEDPDHEIVIEDAAEFALVFPYRRREPLDEATATLAERFLRL
jgi:uncharacterized protein (TIGR03083 family)